MNKYKVSTYARWFEVPLALTCEPVIGYRYIKADSEEEAKEKIIELYKGRLEPFKVEKVS